MTGMLNISSFDRFPISFFRLALPFLDMDLDLDDDVYIYRIDTNRSKENYELYEVYKIHDGGAPILSNIGSSTSKDECCNFVDVGKNIRRHNLRVS